MLRRSFSCSPLPSEQGSSHGSSLSSGTKRRYRSLAPRELDVPPINARWFLDDLPPSVQMESLISSMGLQVSRSPIPDDQVPSRSSSRKQRLPEEAVRQGLQLLNKIPMNEAGEITSLGSIHHCRGQCEPCALWFRGVCPLGALCSQCHFLHKTKNGTGGSSKQSRVQPRSCAVTSEPSVRQAQSRGSMLRSSSRARNDDASSDSDRGEITSL